MKEVDARGLSCPLPVVKTKKALETATDGTINVLVDTPESRQNVERFAASQGCAVNVKEKDGTFYMEITKGKPVAVKPTGKNTVVLITSDRFGTGERELGEILMKAFLNTLWDTGPKPSRIIFINDGVRLTTEGSNMLDTLKLLEEKGVGIFSCGTCLEYYTLKDKLKAGKVTNMYETVNALITADKVINL